jgi:hypothetical protein
VFHQLFNGRNHRQCSNDRVLPNATPYHMSQNPQKVIKFWCGGAALSIPISLSLSPERPKQPKSTMKWTLSLLMWHWRSNTQPCSWTNSFNDVLISIFSYQHHFHLLKLLNQQQQIAPTSRTDTNNSTTSVTDICVRCVNSMKSTRELRHSPIDLTNNIVYCRPELMTVFRDCRQFKHNLQLNFEDNRNHEMTFHRIWRNWMIRLLIWELNCLNRRMLRMKLMHCGTR